VKRIILIPMCIAIILAFPANALADERADSSPIAITVVVPALEEISQPQPVPPAIRPQLYPVSVWETRENGRREIIRVYELGENENPDHIRRESFERDGFRFELAEITRRPMPVYSTRDHVETITVNTQTSDLDTVIRLLSSTLEFMSDDSYFGVLALDISSIQIESDGTTTSNHTATRTREFPHLSSADTSLVPRTVTENGRTYNLANVDWRTQGSTAVDYRQIPTTFTAVATYTRTATRVATIGYTTTAVYRGSLSRIATGRTEFTAQFIGIPIVTPVLGTAQSPEEQAYEVEDAISAEAEPEEASEPQPMSIEIGHFSFTGLNIGNTGIIGHNRGRTNGFFFFVRSLQKGDILMLDADGIVRRYAVSRTFIIDETDFDPLMQFGDNRLTLITCVEYVQSQRRVAVAMEII